MTQATKRVLVVPRCALPEPWLPKEGAVRCSWTAMRAGVEQAGATWLERPLAEHDPAYKQLIPYVRLRDEQGRYGVYRRQGSEQRLHGLWSVGLGGHVDASDAGEPGVPDEAIERAAYRELAEELEGWQPAALRFLGLINEEATEVGEVHLGLVFEGPIGECRPSPGPEIGHLDWMSLADIPPDALERWSRLAVGL